MEHAASLVSAVILNYVCISFVASSSTSQFTYLPHLNGNKCVAETQVFSRTALSMFHCTVMCHRSKYQLCTGVFYEEIQRQCFGCSKFGPGYFDAQPGTVAVTGQCLKYLVKGVKNSQLSESSHWSDNHDASFARLDTKATISGTGSWSVGANDPDPYIQVDFREVKVIEGVVTQGRVRYSQWVTEFQVTLSLDCINWEYVRDKDGNNVTFPGNTDTVSHVINMFDSIKYARCVRLKPTAYHRHMSLRFDVLGCE